MLVPLDFAYHAHDVLIHGNFWIARSHHILQEFVLFNLRLLLHLHVVFNNVFWRSFERSLSLFVHVKPFGYHYFLVLVLAVTLYKLLTLALHHPILLVLLILLVGQKFLLGRTGGLLVSHPLLVVFDDALGVVLRRFLSLNCW